MEGKKEYRIQGEGGSRHAYSEEEVHGFAGLINMLLKVNSHTFKLQTIFLRKTSTPLVTCP